MASTTIRHLIYNAKLSSILSILSNINKQYKQAVCALHNKFRVKHLSYIKKIS